jgi:hypothetical protein
MIPYFQSLGERIERAWLGRGYDEEIFPRLVLDMLGLEPLAEHTGAAEIIDWVFGTAPPLRQSDDPHLFGEPPVLLFEAPRFYIEALFWLSGTTGIHEHAFSGVFSVLAGSSVHSHWRFAAERTVNSRLLCGRLERLSTEILRPGDMRPIHPGNQLIHQLFHLEVPSVTIVIRTHKERRHLPQYEYLLPGLAIDPEDRDGLRRRRLLFLDAMARGRLDGLRERALRWIDSGDVEALHPMFSTLTRRKVEGGLLGELYGRARERHGEIADLVRRVCQGERRTRIVVALRSKVSDPEARFLLALLMLMPDRDAIFETVRLQHPGVEPLAAIETWLERMAGEATIGFELDDVHRALFRALVEGVEPDGLLKRLGATLGADAVAAHRDQLLGHAAKLARSELFRPLFSASPLLAAGPVSGEPAQALTGGG